MERTFREIIRITLKHNIAKTLQLYVSKSTEVTQIDFTKLYKKSVQIKIKLNIIAILLWNDISREFPHKLHAFL